MLFLLYKKMENMIFFFFWGGGGGGGGKKQECLLEQGHLLELTRTVRKSDYTPALALPKHMAGILDEKCREKENTGNNK